MLGWEGTLRASAEEDDEDAGGASREDVGVDDARVVRDGCGGRVYGRASQVGGRAGARGTDEVGWGREGVYRIVQEFAYWVDVGVGGVGRGEVEILSPDEEEEMEE